ncbi:unnamed protein product [Cunninghamella blakesleeana]
MVKVAYLTALVFGYIALVQCAPATDPSAASLTGQAGNTVDKKTTGEKVNTECIGIPPFCLDGFP